MRIPVCVKNLEDWELYYAPLPNGGKMYVQPYLVKGGLVSFPCWGRFIHLDDKDVLLVKALEHKVFSVNIDADLKLAEKQVNDQRVQKVDTYCTALISLYVDRKDKGDPILLTDNDGNMFVLSDSNRVFPIDKRDVAAILRWPSLLKPLQKEGRGKNET